MMDTLIPQLLDFGALGMFAGFLIWLNARSQKRLDEMSEQFQKTLKAQEEAHHLAEEKIRSRISRTKRPTRTGRMLRKWLHT